jgi:heme o synthase
MDGIILFFIMLLWQPPHFWALAQRYKEDYRRAGIPVMPVIMGTNYTNIFMLLYSISLLPLSLSLWLLGYCSVYYALVAIIVGFYFEYGVFRSVLRSADYGMAFGASIIYILILMASLIIDVCLSQSEMILLTTK